MKKQFTAILTLLLLSSTSFSQNKSTYESSESKTNGFRLSLLKPVLDAKVTAPINGQSVSVVGPVENMLGVSAGYADMPVMQIGWSTNLAYLRVMDRSVKGGFLRADGNLAYSFTKKIDVKGGLNFSTVNTEAFSVIPGLGLQASLGVKVLENLGLDIGYVQMSQSGILNLEHVRLKEYGFELGIHATF